MPDKKPFSSTKTGAFLNKVWNETKEHAPAVASKALAIAKNPNPINVISEIGSLVVASKSDKLAKEFEENKADFDREVKRWELENMDRESARRYNFETAASNNVPLLIKIVPALIDIFIMLIWGFLTIYLIARAFGTVDLKTDVSLIMGIWAGVTGLATTVLNFHRGSSQGSKDKHGQLLQGFNKIS